MTPGKPDVHRILKHCDDLQRRSDSVSEELDVRAKKLRRSVEQAQEIARTSRVQVRRSTVKTPR